MSDYIVYLDESGDMGWVFNKPLGKGGSSRYFGIGALIVHKEDHFKVISLLHEFYHGIGLKKPYPKEVKACSLDAKTRSIFISSVLKKAPQFKHFHFCFAYFDKTTLRSQKLKDDTNIIYNYISKHCFLLKIKDSEKALLIADERTTKITTKHGFNDYLKTQLLGDLQSQCDFSIEHADSRTKNGLQLADILTNLSWRVHERADTVIKKASSYISETHVWKD